MRQSKVFALLYNLAMCLLIAAIGVPFFGPAAFIWAVAFFLYGLMPVKLQANGSFHSEVIITIFSKQLQENLYPDNAFYKDSQVDEGVAIGAASVDVPQAGAAPAVIKNPEILPIPARIRADDKKSYTVDLYATQPDIVTDVNQAILSYNKRQAILKDHQKSLETRIADELAYLWSTTKTTTNIIRTTGTGNTGSIVAGQTSTRKELTYQDFINLAALLDRMDTEDDGRRRMLIYSDQVAEIKKIAEFRDFDKTGVVGQLASGAIGRIQNMLVYKRSRPVMFSSALAPKAVGAAVAATDQIGILAWHPDYVRRAEGVVQVYYEAKKVGYQGDMMNAAVRGGGMISRLDERGVAALVQA